MPNEFDALRMQIEAHHQIFSAGLSALRTEMHEMAAEQNESIERIKKALDDIQQTISRYSIRSDEQFAKMMAANTELMRAFDNALQVMSRHYDLYLAGQTDFDTVKADVAELKTLQSQIDELNNRLSALERKEAS